MDIESYRDSFNAKWRLDEATGCWEWTATKLPKGYAFFRGRAFGIHGYIYGHRFSWMLVNGPIPYGMQVCHRCDNPSCVNPEHLFLGSSSDNHQDMKQKGRHLYGELNSEAKLTELQVLEIHEIAKSGLSQKKIAKQFGVGQMTICRILRGERWNHIFLRLRRGTGDPA